MGFNLKNIFCLLLTSGAIVFTSDINAQNQTYPLLRTPQNVSVRRTLPSNVLTDGVAIPASFSANPTDEEFYRIHFFEEPLIPTKDTAASKSENEELLYALAAYSQRKSADDFSSVLKFLKLYPNSRWKGSLLANLGIVYRRTGYYVKAMDAWSASWNILKNSKDPKIMSLSNKVASELLIGYGWTGRLNTIDSMLHQLDQRKIFGSSTYRIDMMRKALWVMKNDPAIAFKCGPYALASIHNIIDSGNRLSDDFQNIKSTAAGFSLAQVQQFSAQIKMRYQMAFRKPGAPIIPNAVVHWKLNHYSALLRVDSNGVYCQDATMGTTWGQNFWLTKAALDSSASGYFLVPAGPLPQGWRTVSESEGRTIFGKGYIPRDPGKHVSESDSTCGGTCPTTGNPPPMAQNNVHVGALSVHIFDRPMFYTPPIGPAVNFTVDYHQKDTYQPSGFTYSSVSPQWTLGWVSYIEDNAFNPESDVNIYIPRGGDRTYVYNYNINGYEPELQTKDILVRVCDNCYELKHPDGSKDIYARPDGGDPSSRKIFLTEIVDPAGNSTSLYYDENLRISAVKDAIGQVTLLSYENADNIWLITKVTDPFGRSASLHYDAEGRLDKITDMIGIVSSFEYDGESNFVQAMTTPYGTTTFISENPDNYNSAIEVHYPQNEKERVEFRESAPGIPFNDPVKPQNIPTFNSYILARNTFFWDKKAMQEAPGDYTKAKIYHWLHGSSDVNENGRTSPVLESIKMPLENRVWYYYQNQRDPGFANQGMSARPYITARVLSNGETQLDSVLYNVIDKPLKIVDPAGRTFSYLYDTTNINLLEVHQTTAGTNELLAKYTYNSQYLPLTATDASGQTKHFTYNQQGQLSSIQNPKNEITKFTYDANGYLTTILGPRKGANVRFKYDAFGRVRTVTDAEGYTIITDYDALNRPTVITYPDSSFEQIVYDRLDAVKVKDRLGRWTSTTYDSLDRPVKIMDAFGRVTQYVWCNCGSLAEIIDPLNHITSFTRDIEGRLTSKTYNDGKSITYAYDTIGRLTNVTDAKRQVTRYSYFIDDNIDSINYENSVVATPPVSFTYDPHYNRVVTMNDSTGTTMYSYNPISAIPALGAGRLASIDGPLSNDLIQYKYDSLGRTNGRIINGVASSVNFDALGRVSDATNVLGKFIYAYVNQTSRISSILYPNGQNTIFNYFDNVGDQRLKEIWNKGSNGITLSKFDYEYNAVGQISKWTQQSGTDVPKYYDLGYDNADQLTSAIQKMEKPAAIINQYFYKYDAAGNRLREQVNNSFTVSEYNPLNQLTQRWSADSLRSDTTVIHFPQIDSTIIGDTFYHHNYPSIPGTNPATEMPPFTHYIDSDHIKDTLTYDDNGNTVSTFSPHSILEWDAADRLVKIIQDSSVIEFVYNGLGRRILEKVNGTIIKRWLWEGDDLVEERDASGSKVNKSFFKQGEQIKGKNYYFTFDQLQSVREITDMNGIVQARYDYDPYGRRIKTFGSLDADFGFTKFFVENSTGLYLTGYRSFDANLGRWLSRDPLKEEDDLNLYAYVTNQPISYSDPLGLSRWRDVAVPTYGNWGGPDWSGGWRPSDHNGQEGPKPPIDVLDAAAQIHDRAYQAAGVQAGDPNSGCDEMCDPVNRKKCYLKWEADWALVNAADALKGQLGWYADQYIKGIDKYIKPKDPEYGQCHADKCSKP